MNLYFFRDHRGLEVDFIVPEGNKVTLIESKWKHQSGTIPKNIRRFQSVVGEENIKAIKVITSGSEHAQIDSNCFLTNLIDL